jgi:hypothetical protein
MFDPVEASKLEARLKDMLRREEGGSHLRGGCDRDSGITGIDEPTMPRDHQSTEDPDDRALVAG